MAGFVDVLLRGVMLVGAAAALGGVAFVWAVLRAGPGIKPDPRTRVLDLGAAAASPFARTSFALASLARAGIAVATALLALRLARHPGGRATWTTLAVAAVLLVSSSASISHAMARLDNRVTLLALDAAHQLAAGVGWAGSSTSCGDGATV